MLIFPKKTKNLCKECILNFFELTWRDKLKNKFESDDKHYIIVGHPKHNFELITTDLLLGDEHKIEHKLKRMADGDLVLSQLNLFQEMQAFCNVVNETVPEWNDLTQTKYGLTYKTSSFGEPELFVGFNSGDEINSFVYGLYVATFEFAEEMKEEFKLRICELYCKQY